MKNSPCTHIKTDDFDAALEKAKAYDAEVAKKMAENMAKAKADADAAAAAAAASTDAAAAADTSATSA